MTDRGASTQPLPARERPEPSDAVHPTASSGTVPPGAGCLHHWIQAQARRTPLAPALLYEGGTLSYRELDKRANRIATCLRSLGIGVEELVGVAMDRSPELVVSLLAVLKAGGAYVPLDPDLPSDRLRFMAEECEAKVILSQPSMEDRLPASGTALIHTGDIWHVGDGDPPADRSDERDLAYVMYTSGSTGRPKGVMIEHRSIVNRLRWMQDQFRLDASDVVLQKTPFSFDVSLWELFWPTMVGARMAIAREGGHKDSGYLARLIEDAGVTVTHFVPSMLELFLEVPGLRRRCASLRHVICSGESLSRDVVNRFYDRMPDGVELWNLYGPTEAAVDVTYWRCRRDERSHTVPIGRPVANTQVDVVDEKLEAVPAGTEGELLIRGVQVGRGYWRRPELTEAAFVPDPDSPSDEARAYRTGDRGRKREDGVIEFLGRADGQVKLRGQRIELGEIESVLRNCAGVRQAVADVREDSGEKRLVGYVVPEDGTTVDPAALRADLARRLPSVMVPAHVVTLDELPLSPNGKLDRKALPAPARDRPGLDRAYLPPRTPLEEHVAELWADTLNLKRVGIRDPFFELGGSSLDAARFVARIQEELDEFIYVVTVFDAPTVEDYAAFLATEYPDAVSRRFGADAASGGATRSSAVDGEEESGWTKLDEDDLTRFAEAVPVHALRATPPQGPRNPRAVFILAPPRSGTTLLRVMLAGHPDLFAASELQLLHFETLGDRRAAFTGRFSAWLEGTLRAVMELKDCDADEAKARMAELEARDVDVRAFYGMLQEWAGDRTLVDKSPSYALDPNALARAERDFEDPFYIHLVRHPYAMVESFVRRHMDQILYLHDHDFDARELGELVWLASNRNVADFLRDVPARRQVMVNFEDLVRRPRETMISLSGRMGIPFDPALTDPYGGLEQKMVDGIHDDSLPMGDTRLLTRNRIDPSLADRWEGVLENDYLSAATWDVAEAFGYRGRSSGTERRRRAPAGRAGPERRRAMRRRRLDARRQAGQEGD